MEFKEIFVRGYDVTDPELGRRSSASFKLDLRNACKTEELYFSSVADVELPFELPVKNIGQLLFGTPQWKGLFTMRVDREGKETADISIHFDRRSSLFPEEVTSKLWVLLEVGLEILKSDGIIEDFERRS